MIRYAIVTYRHLQECLPMKPVIKPSSRAAFTLVELSIVLVVLGLLAGGILGGQAMIRSAELRTVVTQTNQLITAIQTFREQYNGLPGDLSTATEFWGSAGGNGTDATCYGLQSANSMATCNGDGDSRVDNNAYDYAERFAAWKHLSNARLVDGKYTGKTAGAQGSYTQDVGVNVLRAKIYSGFFDIYYNSSSTGNPHFATGTQLDRNFISLYGNTPSYGVLTPKEAWNIDTKLDDGDPFSGDVISTKKSSTVGPNCTSSDAAPGSYNLKNTDITCVLHIGAQN
ncbi:MAG: prepilin-type N-terminal cleavage/methylation domain-containing protein [Pseudomonadota bacterium]